MATTTAARPVQGIGCEIEWEDRPLPPFVAAARCRTLLGPLGAISRGGPFRAMISRHVFDGPDLSLSVTIPRRDWREGESAHSAQLKSGVTVGTAQRLDDPIPVDLGLAPPGPGEANPWGWGIAGARAALQALVFDDGWVPLLHPSTVREMLERAAGEAASITVGAVSGRGGWQ